MSILSSVTGIGINPFGKDKIKIDPKKAALTALTAASMGGLGPLGAALGHIPGAAAVAGGLSKAKTALSAIPGVEGAGSFLGKVGGALKTGAAKTFMPNGELDLGKVGSVIGAGANLYGQAKQRKSATNYNNAQIDQRNQLMSKILAPQNYNLPDINPNGTY